jgi:Xaa-Pro aminopeptidase
MSRVIQLMLICGLLVAPTSAQEARQRWERMNEIRREKFDLVLPEVMRENRIDMWITMIREANYGTLHADFGHGYTMDHGYYVFTDRGGDRIERAVLGVDGPRLERGGAWDLFLPVGDLASFVAERDPQRIGLNMSRSIGPADQLSHTGYQQIVETLGEPWASRLVSAEKLVSDFRSRRVASEIAAFAEAGEISRRLAEEAFSNQVITPDVTTLEDVAWWLMDRLLERGLDTSFGLPSIYVTGPNGIEAMSNERVIRRGDLMMIDWGVGFLNYYTDMKRIAYVLRDGEDQAPAGLQHAFERAKEARAVVKGAIRAGVTAEQAAEEIYVALTDAGFQRIEFNQPTEDSALTDVVIGCHSVGNSGHGIGPSIAFFNPTRMGYMLRPTNLLSIELFAYTSNPDWGGAKVRIPLEDDAVVTERGVEWLYPANQRLLLIK